MTVSRETDGTVPADGVGAAVSRETSSPAGPHPQPEFDALRADPRTTAFFGTAYPVVDHFARLLAEDGVLRGLIGPREVPRLWSRHLVNCAAVARFLPVEQPSRASVTDLGSGAGLPGVVLAAMRPDLAVTLIEPMERRVRWLTEVVETLGLGNVEVVRARAEELHGRRRFDVVTARAVAPLDRLARWSAPLLSPGGAILALKGRSAADEVDAAASALRALGLVAQVHEVTAIEGVDSTVVVRLVRQTGSRRGGS